MLKHTKLIKVINYSITISNIKLCNNKLPELPILSPFLLCARRIQTSFSIPFEDKESNKGRVR